MAYHPLQHPSQKHTIRPMPPTTLPNDNTYETDPPTLITIMGSSSPHPAGYLPEGEVMTTVLTEHAMNLIQGGHVVVIDHPENVQKLISAGKFQCGKSKCQPQPESSP